MVKIGCIMILIELLKLTYYLDYTIIHGSRNKFWTRLFMSIAWRFSGGRDGCTGGGLFSSIMN